ncbi:MAG: Hsp70 family protein, partial [Streptomyces sp.]|nr:Hsp70 family protein [Streptomyces sp.]
MLGIAIGHRIARIGRLDPEGRPTVTATDLAGTDGVADPATALTMLLAEVTGEEAVATGEEAVLGLPAAAGREAEADLRRAAEDAGLRVNRIVPEPVAVALHYGAIDEGVHRTVLVVDQAATTVDLTVLAITPDLTVRIVTTRTAQLADDHALTATAQELTEAAPDAVLLSGDLYTTPAHRTDIENLADAQGLTMRCRTPELAVVHGLLLLEDFGLLRIATGPAPARTHFPSPLEDPEPQPWSIPVADPEPQNAPPDNAPKGPGAVPTPPRGREQPPPPDSEPPTATTPPIPTP